MPHQQRIYEERGRFTEFHCTYQNRMARQALMDARERTQDPEVHKYVEKELEWLKEQQQEMMREVPTLDLDSLYGKNTDRDRDEKSREPDKSLNLDEIKFDDPLKDKDRVDDRDKTGEKDQNREQQPAPEKGLEAATEHKLGQDDQATQQQTQDQTRDMTDAQHGQQMHEQTVFKPKTDDREDEERESDERERR